MRITSPGPALFRQDRVGYRHRPFVMLKFRSMRVDAKHARSPTPLHLDRIKARVAAYIEDGAAGKVTWNGMGEAPPLQGWIIPEKMIRRGLHTADLDVVKPITQCADTLRHFLTQIGLDFGRVGAHATACSG